MRVLTYVQAIREAHAQLLASDPRVFLIGQGLWSPWYAGASLQDIENEFGRHRVLDSPVSENATTGVGVGAAIVGMRPIVFHPRMDFMLLAADAIINQAANWCYMFGGQANVPVVIRSVINRGGQQAAQHSQALQGIFMHVPGLKVVMPSTPYDCKGLLIAAVSDGNPVLYIDDRWLYEERGEVPEEMYTIPIGEAAVRREGSDVTIVATSYMAAEAWKAVNTLSDQHVDAELIDLRTVKPWDEEQVFASVRKTGRLVVVDGAWGTCGVASEIAARVASKMFDHLKSRIVLLTLPDVPAPMSGPLEEAYYLRGDSVVAAIEKLLAHKEE